MSRYFQQLARHAGLAPSRPVSAGLPANAAPVASHSDITEEIVERDAVPAQPGMTTVSAPPSDPPVQPSTNPPAEAGFLARAQTPENNPTPAIPEKNSPPARSIPAERAAKSPPARGRQPVATKSPATPDAATVIQQVIAWVGEPERARTAPSPAAPAPALPAGKTVSASIPSSVPPENALPVASQPATVKIMPAARKDAARPSPALEPDKKGPGPGPDSPARLEVMASPMVPPRARLGPAAEAPSLRREDPAQEFNVSIGSIHLTVETPPPAAPAPRAPAPRPVPAPARTGGLATSARRHYLRSFT